MLFYSINNMNVELVSLDNFKLNFKLFIINFQGIKDLIMNFLNYVNTAYNQDLLSMLERMKLEHANSIRSCLRI